MRRMSRVITRTPSQRSAESVDSWMFDSTTVVSVRIVSARSTPSDRAKRTSTRWIASHVEGWIRFTLS